MRFGFGQLILIVFSAAWLSFSFLQYDLLLNGDCSYMRTPECAAKLKYGPQLIFWRAAAIELAALSLYLYLWKRR